MTDRIPQVLTIAGTDSGGGAGVMADLKTFQMRHVFGTAVVVAVTAQNTVGVQNFVSLSETMVHDQFKALADDFTIKACKTGMLADAEHVRFVVHNLKKYHFGPLIVDPVMIAKGGAQLLADDAISVVKQALLPLATLITPNIPEAERLSGQTIKNRSDMQQAAQKLKQLGAKNVLIKGGHLASQAAADYVLLADGRSLWLETPRFETKNTHGTGDTISACIVAELAKGYDLLTALKTAKQFIYASIANPIEVGHGHGPLNLWAYTDGYQEENDEI
ncbi:bifunctional hydroxymethylpyrimidine kinase/phosphomethylpyrimidine kinase [Agrilactobacillus fermenti]|uniref:bifunctional hydroxymethylpyrimidine kinase/phosphomethylpyrimidine kinase n=1 Tax=Agrilactobacillus fermenti TaxID=2586909 RepID=UPI001E51891E|nr:bifunctional hydroxymethylpyrimidine kinase/phosphomethylpyrimidine kinase [Agrilactobacillus fermenti]MCD2256870.1 bifunctional hydroxymethylpyrimidine kinase/phosphomethylpyrimidine kinase [Agrilactobacillus fermenti]